MNLHETITKATIETGDFTELRAKGIGGSDVATILRKNSYKSPRQLWKEKTGRAEPFNGNYYTLRGKRREPAIRAAFPGYYEALTGLKIAIQDVTGMSFVSKEYSILRANLDGLVLHPTYGVGILEIKTASSGDEWANNQVPAAYWLQVQHYMLVTGLDYTIVAAEIDGYAGIEYRIVLADPEFQKDWPCQALNFWNFVLTDTDPGLASENADGVAEEFPQALDDEVLPVSDMDMILQEYQTLGGQIKTLEDRKDEIKAMIEATIGTHKGIRGSVLEVTWSNGSRSSIDTKALETAYPEIATAYKRTTTFRTLRIKELKI